MYTGPPVRNSRSMSNMGSPSQNRRVRFSLVVLAIGVAMTSHIWKMPRTSSTFSGLHVHIMRSWDSDTQISHGASPGSFSGTRSRSTSAPQPASRAISPTTQLSPPPPRSFMPVMRCLALTSKHACMTGSFVMGSPSWTAPLESSSDVAVRSAEAKLTPWMPSRPVRPPMRIMTSPGPPA